MKKTHKIIFINLILFLIILVCNRIYAVTITLEMICSKFNDSKFVKEYSEVNTEIKATNDNNSINVVFKPNGEEPINIKIELNNNILICNVPMNAKGTEFGAHVGTINTIVDCIGQIYGYEEGEKEHTKHLQGYFQLKLRDRLNTIKNKMGINTIHLEHQR